MPIFEDCLSYDEEFLKFDKVFHSELAVITFYRSSHTILYIIEKLYGRCF